MSLLVKVFSVWKAKAVFRRTRLTGKKTRVEILEPRKVCMTGGGRKTRVLAERFRCFGFLRVWQVEKSRGNGCREGNKRVRMVVGFLGVSTGRGVRVEPNFSPFSGSILLFVHFLV